FRCVSRMILAASTTEVWGSHQDTERVHSSLTRIGFSFTLSRGRLPLGRRSPYGGLSRSFRPKRIGDSRHPAPSMHAGYRIRARPEPVMCGHEQAHSPRKRLALADIVRCEGREGRGKPGREAVNLGPRVMSPSRRSG